MARLMSSLAILFAVSTSVGGVTVAGPASTSGSDALLNLVKEFEGFKKQLNTIEARLMALQMTLEQKSTSDDSRCWVRDIAEAIRAVKYSIAEEKLIELSNDDRIPNIVHDVYSGSSANVDVILEFAKALHNPDRKFLVYSALRDEMRANGNSDPLRLIALAEELKRELLRLKSPEMKKKAQVVIDKTVGNIKAAAIGTLKTAMIANKYQGNVEVESLAIALSNFDSDVSDEVMEGVVDSVFGVVAAETIIENVSSHTHIPQVITALTAVFNRFNFAGNLNNRATLKLSSSLRQLQLRESYPNLSKSLKGDVDKIIQQLPLCARNLFFSANVCLFNKGRGMYLYAASTSISRDEQRRSIYMWYPGNLKHGVHWDVQQIGADFYFKNTDYKDEYFYAAELDYNKDMRLVFNWIPGNNTDPQSAWSIELDGDYCYMKSSFFNEYLFAPSVKYDEMNTYVFTWKPGTAIKTAEYQWQLRNCGQT